MGLLGRLISAILPATSASPPGATTPDQPPPAVTPAAVDPGIALVQHFEQCAKRLPSGLIVPYLDGGGEPTIGWGSTFYLDGRPVKMTDSAITQAQADALFEKVYADFRSRVAALLPADAKPHEIGALTCFAYNIGIGYRTESFRTSTALKRFLTGDKAGCGDALEWWNKDNGIVVRGLQKRRRAEKLVLMGMAVDAAIAQAEKDYPKK